jgi:outer membrane receptor protein involved in Fe transport
VLWTAIVGLVGATLMTGQAAAQGSSSARTGSGSVLGAPDLVTHNPPSRKSDKSARLLEQPQQIQEVVVTANKRHENARKIPTSIGVISGAELADHHIETLEDVTRVLPGVSFAAHNGPGQDNISIRGVSSTVGNPTVGIYLDEVPIITQNGYEGMAQPRFLDLDRIEVLRGPQGTLYGASSEGGTIRFLTNQPDLKKFSGSISSDVSGTVHAGANTDQQIVVNLPVIKDVFGIRVAGEFLDDSGWINSKSLSGQSLKDGTNYNRTGDFHITAKWLPTPDLTITPSYYYQNLFVGDSPNFFEGLGLYNQDKQVRERTSDKISIPSLTIRQRLGFGDITSITSYYTRDIDRYADGTYFNSTAIADFFLDPAYPSKQTQNDQVLGNVPSPVLFTDRFKTWTQEVRLASQQDQRLRWLIGFFYSDQKWSHLDYETAPGFSSDFNQIYGYDINQSILGVPGVPNEFPNDLVWTVYDHNEITQYAGFGQLDWDVTKRLHLSAGERYVAAHETFSETGGGFFDLGGAGTTGTAYKQSAEFTAPTPKFSATFDLTPLSTLYATIAKGFRLGGATTPNTNISCVAGLGQLGFSNAPNTYGSDQLWSYEAGSKSLLLNRSLSLDVAGYYIDWSRIQETITIPICGGAFNYNVGNAAAYGGEVEARYKPPAVRGLTIGLNAGAEHASVTSTINAQTAEVGENVLFVPSWSAAAIIDYYTMLSPHVIGFLHADYDWTGPSNGSFQRTDPNFQDPAYSVLNMSLGAELKHGLTLSLYAQNLLDNKIIIQRPVINSVVQAYTLRPATVGLNLTQTF